MSTATVPSLYAFFRVMRTRPSGRCAELDLICREDPDRPRIVILNYPSNPTGQTYSVDALEELAEVARRYRVILLSDASR